MKTRVVIKRPFMGSEVSQQSDTRLFSATELVKIGNQKRKELGLSPFNLSQFIKTKATREFIEELQKLNGIVIDVAKGRYAGTWVHPLLFIDVALAIQPKFKIEVYTWVYDELVKYRNDSGDSYRKMCGSLYDNSPDKARFHKFIPKVATFIKTELKVDDWNTASEAQLKIRDKIHENISFLVGLLKDNKQAVGLGVRKTIKDAKNEAELTNKLF